MDWKFTIGSLNTVELKGVNTNGTITFSPPITISPGVTRSANLKASLKDYPTKFVDNAFQVIAYTATLAKP